MVTLGIKISMYKFELTQTFRPQHCKITCVYIPIRVKGIQQTKSIIIKKILEINKGVIKMKKKKKTKHSNCGIPERQEGNGAILNHLKMVCLRKWMTSIWKLRYLFILSIS